MSVRPAPRRQTGRLPNHGTVLRGCRRLRIVPASTPVGVARKRTASAAASG